MHNNHLTNNSNLPKLLSEALQYKDLEGMMKSTVHVDEFSAKMGDDEDIIVISFFVRDLQEIILSNVLRFITFSPPLMHSISSTR